jgi:hypothetical protein
VSHFETNNNPENFGTVFALARIMPDKKKAAPMFSLEFLKTEVR